MKLPIKMMIAILVISILLPFTLLKGKDGAPLLSFNDLKLPGLNILPGVSEISEAVQDSGGNDVIYKWTDNEGNFQFSNSPPPAGVEYTEMAYDPNLNVIQAVVVEPEIPEEVVEEESQIKVKNPGDIGNFYSPEKIEKLFEDANNIENLLNQRLTDQEALLGQ